MSHELHTDIRSISEIQHAHDVFQTAIEECPEDDPETLETLLLGASVLCWILKCPDSPGDKFAKCLTELVDALRVMGIVLIPKSDLN